MNVLIGGFPIRN